jgi:hypothetical protein
MSRSSRDRERRTAIQLRPGGGCQARVPSLDGGRLLSGVFLEGGNEHTLEVMQSEGLHEVRGGVEIESRLLSGEDAREDDGTTEVPDVPGELEACEIAGLDHRRIDVRHAAAVPVGVDRLVPKPPDYVLQEGADIGMGLNDENPRHRRMIRSIQMDPVDLRV